MGFFFSPKKNIPGHSILYNFMVLQLNIHLIIIILQKNFNN